MCVWVTCRFVTAFESDGPERDFLICWINVLPSLSRYLMSTCLSAPPGGGSLRPVGSGDVSVEPAGLAGSLYVFLASAVRPADLLLLQHQRSAYLERKALVSLSYQVKPLQLQLPHQWLWEVFFNKCQHFLVFFKMVIRNIHLCTSVGSCPQYCRMLQYAILPAGPRFHSLLHCSGSSYPLQVLSSRLPSLHEWQHHAQVWVGASVYTPVILSVFGCSVERLACPCFVSAGGWQRASRCWSSLSRLDLLNFRSFTERSSCPSSSSLSLLPSCSQCWR